MAIGSGLPGIHVRVGAKRTQLIKFTADGAVYGFATDRVSETSRKISVPSGGGCG
jgi:hypothetical protein